MYTLRLTLLLVAISTTVGCGLNTASQEDQDLFEVAAAWRGYHDVNRCGPDDWNQLLAFAKGHPPLNQDALKRARQAGWELKWSLGIRDLTTPEHDPMRDGPMVNVVIGTLPSGKRLYMNGWVRSATPAQQQVDAKARTDVQERLRIKNTPSRKWYNQDGSFHCEGKFIRADDKYVTIAGKGSVSNVAISVLSADDQEYIKRMRSGGTQ